MKDNLEQVLKKLVKVSISIRNEWTNREIIKPLENPEAQFKCTDCGNCCSFEDQFCWVYPSDLREWEKQVTQDEFVHLLFGTIFELLDNQGMKGLGLPSQRAIGDIFSSFFEDPLVQEDYKQVCRSILAILKKINTNFNESSNYCIFYDPKASKHCLIYPYRPLQCRTYPFDASWFVRIQIPQDLEKKYPLIEDVDAVPFCPPNAYVNDPRKGVIITEKERDLVLQEKVDHFTSIQTQDEMQKLNIQMQLLMKHQFFILKLIGRPAK